MTTHAEALRKLADFIDANPHLNIGTGYDKTSVHADGDSLNIFIRSMDKSADEIRAEVNEVSQSLGGIWREGGNESTRYLSQTNVLDFFETTIFSDREVVNS